MSGFQSAARFVDMYRLCLDLRILRLCLDLRPPLLQVYHMFLSVVSGIQTAIRSGVSHVSVGCVLNSDRR